MNLTGKRSLIQRAPGFILTFLLLTTGWGCSPESKEKAPPQKPVPVLIVSVKQKSVPIQIKAIGTVQASTTVSARSLVGGKIVGVHFREGQEVRKGELLFTIDSRSFDLAVKQAESNLARDLALAKQAEANIARDTVQAKNARIQAERYQSLVEKQLVSQEQYDQVRTTNESLEATLLADRAALENAKAAVQADKAALENAKIQLGHCFISSPIAGRTGNLLVHPGNIIKDGDTLVLAVVNQIKPVYVTFSLPEKYLLEIRKYMVQGKLKVEAHIPNDAQAGEEGVLDFLDNTIDNSTGTIQLKGLFLNKTQRLWPGQFVNVTLTLAIQPEAIVVPSKAIQTGQRGQQVFVVGSDLTVESRAIVVERVVNEESIIAQGLKPGERVVIEGQLQLVPGRKVEIKKTPADKFGEKA